MECGDRWGVVPFPNQNVALLIAGSQPSTIRGKSNRQNRTRMTRQGISLLPADGFGSFAKFENGRHDDYQSYGTHQQHRRLTLPAPLKAYHESVSLKKA